MVGTAELEPIKAAMVASTLDAIVVVGEDGCVLGLNRAAESLFGYSLEEATGRPIGDLIVPEHLREAHSRGFGAYLAGGQPKVLGKRAETEAMHKDGRVFPVELTVLEVKVEGRRVFTATIRDRSEDAAQEEELLQTRRQLELAVQGAKLGVWSYDPRTGSSWFSDRARDLLGLPSNILDEARELRAHVHPDDWDKLAAPYLTTYPHEPLPIEYRVLKPDGGIRWVYGLGAAIRDENDVPQTVHGILADITERKEGDEELEDSRRRLELAVEGAKLGTWTHDLPTGETWYSDRSKQMYGLPADTVMTTEVIKAAIHPDHWDEVAHPYLHGFTKDKVEVEYRVVCPDGSVRWIYSLGATESEEDGVAHTVHGIHLDITERKQAEEDLAETRRQLEMAIDGAKLGSWTVDPETGSTWYSDRSREMHGIARELRLDAKMLKSYIHPDDWDLVLKSYREGFPGDTVALEHRVVWPDGEVRWVQSAGTALRDETGRVRLVSGVHLDITDKKVAQEELEHSRDALHQSEKLAAMGTLLAGVSHELNNPLAAIVGQAEMLEEDAAGTLFEVRAKKISQAAERCARIVQTFLAMARQKEPQRSLVGMNEIIASALELTEYALRTAGISVQVTFGSGLPPVDGDRDQLHQVLVNLIINAQQAMAGGETFDKKLTIRTSVGPSGRVLIDVGDTGPGIPEKARPRIFEPFFTTKQQGSGTGIGLAFSLGIVEAHGGKLTLEPSRRGALFRIALPAAPQTDLVAVPIVPETASGGRGGRALVVDDEPDVADTLRELLEREGYQVNVARDGASALLALDRDEYDLIVSDLRMPGISGPELHARLAETRPHLLDRMAFVTGDTLGSNMDEFLRGCGRPVLEKPFTKTGVRCLIAALAELRITS